MIRREMLVTQIKAAESQYDVLRTMPGQREARVLVSHRIAVLRKQLADHDAVHGRPAFRQNGNGLLSTERVPFWQVAAGVGAFVAVIVAGALYALGAL